MSELAHLGDRRWDEPPSIARKKKFLGSNARTAIDSIDTSSTKCNLPENYRAQCAKLLGRIASLSEEAKNALDPEWRKLQEEVGALMYVSYTLHEQKTNGKDIDLSGLITLLQKF